LHHVIFMGHLVLVVVILVWPFSFFKTVDIFFPPPVLSWLLRPWQLECIDVDVIN
jgi:hypothetical protein